MGKKLGPVLLLVVAAFVGYLFIGGSLSKGGASGGDFGSATDRGQEAVDKGQTWWADLVAQPWFYSAAAALILAVFGFTTWQKIGNWGRMLVLFLLGIAAAVWLFRVAA